MGKVYHSGTMVPFPETPRNGSNHPLSHSDESDAFEALRETNGTLGRRNWFGTCTMGTGYPPG